MFCPIIPKIKVDGMSMRMAIFCAIFSTMLLYGCALAENEPSETDSAIQYYLYEDEPGPLYWEAEKQTDLGNLEQARELFRQSCDSGVAGSCAVLAIMHQDGDGGDVDNLQACQLFQKSCTMGFAQACYVVAGILEGDLCGPPDLAHSRKLYAIACNAGRSDACVDVAEFHEYGLGGNVDRKVAKNLYAEACSGQEREGCTQYARMVLSETGDEAEREAAITLIEQGCAENDAKSCYLLAKTQVSAENVSKKVMEYFAIARTGFQNACANSDETDDFEPCYNYYYMVARGEGGPMDVKSARKFFEQACAEGHEPSCKEFSVVAKLK